MGDLNHQKMNEESNIKHKQMPMKFTKINEDNFSQRRQKQRGPHLVFDVLRFWELKLPILFFL